VGHAAWSCWSQLQQAERDAFVSDLGRGASTRAGLLRRIVEDDRVRSAKRNEAFVTMQYFGYLRRDPDEAGYQSAAEAIAYSLETMKA